MLSFLKSKKQKEREHIDSLLSFYTARIARNVDLAEKFHAEGQFETAFMNHAGRLRRCLDLSLIEWRQHIDPRERIKETVRQYDVCLNYLAEHDADNQLNLKSLMATFDTEAMDVLAWLNGDQVSLRFISDPSWFFFDGCLNYLVREIMDIEVPEEDKKQFLGQIEAEHSLAHTALQDIAKILGVLASDESPQDIVERASANWELRRESDFFRENGGDYSGFNGSNYLYLDYYLAAALRQSGHNVETIHKWIW